MFSVWLQRSQLSVEILDEWAPCVSLYHLLLPIFLCSVTLHSSARARPLMLHSSPCSRLHSHRSQIRRLPLNRRWGERILKGEEHPLDRQPWPGERTRSRRPGCSVRSTRVAPLLGYHGLGYTSATHAPLLRLAAPSTRAGFFWVYVVRPIWSRSNPIFPMGTNPTHLNPEPNTIKSRSNPSNPGEPSIQTHG